MKVLESKKIAKSDNFTFYKMTTQKGFFIKRKRSFIGFSENKSPIYNKNKVMELRNGVTIEEDFSGNHFGVDEFIKCMEMAKVAQKEFEQLGISWGDIFTAQPT